MTTSALVGGSPCPTLPEPVFKSRNQTPVCSPYMDISVEDTPIESPYMDINVKDTPTGLAPLIPCYLTGQTDRCPE